MTGSFEKAIVAGVDWGARTAVIVAALCRSAAAGSWP
jgi:hypothetical protein